MSDEICGDVCADDPGGEFPCLRLPGHDGSHQNVRKGTWARPRHEIPQRKGRPPGSDTGYTKHVTYTFEADGDCWGAGSLSERNMLIGFPGAEAGDCQLEVVLSGDRGWRMPESSRRRLKAEYELDANTDAMADAIEAHISKHGPPPRD